MVDVALPAQRVPPEDAVMTQWVIYEKPSDYPDGYVLRAAFIMKGNQVMIDNVAWYAADPDELRAIMPTGFVRLARMEQDDPVILETWI